MPKGVVSRTDMSGVIGGIGKEGIDRHQVASTKKLEYWYQLFF